MKTIRVLGLLLLIAGIAFADGTTPTTYYGDVPQDTMGAANVVPRCDCNLVCPQGAIPEGECCPHVCDHFNGGCYSNPFAVSTISCGEVVCGTAFAGLLIRDTDWYQLVTTQRDTVRWSVDAEFAALIAILGPGENGCEDFAEYASQTTEECHPACLTAVLDPGTYWLYVAPRYFWWLDCSDYVASVTCVDTQLAAELLGFEAAPSDNGIEIRWQTASESQNDYFEILRDGAVMSRVNADNAATGATYHWTDRTVQMGTSYEYSLVAVDLQGARTTLGSRQVTASMPGAAQILEYRLYQNYPNPFNPNTTIAFDLAQKGFVTLKIYNMVGQEVAMLANSVLSQGHHVVNFDASHLPSAMYLCTMQAGSYTETRKMLLMK
jgi:hypothetical protein